LHYLTNKEGYAMFYTVIKLNGHLKTKENVKITSRICDIDLYHEKLHKLKKPRLSDKTANQNAR
jgi:hypothetical protein